MKKTIEIFGLCISLTVVSCKHQNDSVKDETKIEESINTYQTDVVPENIIINNDKIIKQEVDFYNGQYHLYTYSAPDSSFRLKDNLSFGFGQLHYYASKSGSAKYIEGLIEAERLKGQEYLSKKQNIEDSVKQLNSLIK